MAKKKTKAKKSQSRSVQPRSTPAHSSEGDNALMALLGLGAVGGALLYLFGGVGGKCKDGQTRQYKCPDGATITQTCVGGRYIPGCSGDTGTATITDLTVT